MLAKQLNAAPSRFNLTEKINVRTFQNRSHRPTIKPVAAFGIEAQHSNERRTKAVADVHVSECFLYFIPRDGTGAVDASRRQGRSRLRERGFMDGGPQGGRGFMEGGPQGGRGFMEGGPQGGRGFMEGGPQGGRGFMEGGPQGGRGFMEGGPQGLHRKRPSGGRGFMEGGPQGGWGFMERGHSGEKELLRGK
ncbi:protein FAM98A-like [Penaeus japonicus]|uniref:protein FAM98A-like n=1 Tax=Penaeus japonicus TaxID=27405 RepID=UPI001C71250F|nr:protein FAM98A-like [Penaeus japonicus]